MGLVNPVLSTGHHLVAKACRVGKTDYLAGYALVHLRYYLVGHTYNLVNTCMRVLPQSH